MASKGFYTWSQVSNTNASADSTINWSEGQPPSSINDSARAMMARLAEYRDDTAGAIAATGTASAYAVASNQVFSSTAGLHFQEISFVAPATNALGVTLNVDGLGALPIVGTDGNPLPAGTLLANGVYSVLANSVEFILKGFTGNPYNVPLAGGMDYWGQTPPNSNFAFPVGQAISRTTYANLFALISTIYGAGDGSTTFNIPDKRGLVSAGNDGMGGTLAGRLSNVMASTTMGAMGGASTHVLTVNEIPSHTHSNTVNDPGHTHSASFLTQGLQALVGGVAQWGSNNTGAVNGAVTVLAAATGITINNAAQGGGGGHAIVQPTIICNYIMRII